MCVPRLDRQSQDGAPVRSEICKVRYLCTPDSRDEDERVWEDPRDGAGGCRSACHVAAVFTAGVRRKLWGSVPTYVESERASEQAGKQASSDADSDDAAKAVGPACVLCLDCCGCICASAWVRYT